MQLRELSIHFGRSQIPQSLMQTLMVVVMKVSVQSAPGVPDRLV